MDVLKDWAVMVCSAAIGSAFCVFLIPDGKLKKTAEVGVALIVLILVSAPLRNNDLPQIDDVVAVDEYDIPADYNAISFYKEYAEKFIIDEIKKILVSLCENNTETEIVMYEESENEFVLKNITIYVDPKDLNKKNEIISQVSKLTGIVPEVVVIGEN